MKIQAPSPYSLLKTVLTVWGCMQLASACSIWTNHARYVLAWPGQPLAAAAKFDELHLTGNYTAKEYDSLLRSVYLLRCKMLTCNTVIITQACGLGNNHQRLSVPVCRKYLAVVRRMFGFPSYIDVLVEKEIGCVIAQYAARVYGEAIEFGDSAFLKSSDYSTQMSTRHQRIEQLSQDPVYWRGASLQADPGIIYYGPNFNHIQGPGVFVTRQQLVLSGMSLYEKIREDLVENTTPVQGSHSWAPGDFIRATAVPRGQEVDLRCRVYSIDQNSMFREVDATNNYAKWALKAENNRTEFIDKQCGCVKCCIRTA